MSVNSDWSFEVFPPKDGDLDRFAPVLQRLGALQPDFISVTRGAGGAGEQIHERAAALIALCRAQLSCAVTAHLPCIYLTRAQAKAQLDHLKEDGVNRVLALRGDLREDAVGSGDFAHASELITFIREHYGDYFKIYAACYPEKHQEAASWESDIAALLHKVKCGVDTLISQLFFDNSSFYRFYDELQRHGMSVPVRAGILPVDNKKQVERMTSMCGAAIPAALGQLLERYGDDQLSLREAGLDYALHQIEDLRNQGQRCVHLYTMNKAEVAEKICKAFT
ncbi:MAG: methylenetetrahydrofolate reductase [Succinivibrio sp.]|nr:methylenetetrahydrofolate reductase [Succinivibrio sp.]